MRRGEELANYQLIALPAISATLESYKPDNKGSHVRKGLLKANICYQLVFSSLSLIIHLKTINTSTATLALTKQHEVDNKTKNFNNIFAFYFAI